MISGMVKMADMAVVADEPAVAIALVAEKAMAEAEVAMAEVCARSTRPAC